MFSSVCFPKNQFYLHKLHIHTHTLKHPWHFLPFQIIIVTKRKLFFPPVWLCDFDFWSYFALDDDLLTLQKTWKLILLWLPLCDQKSISKDCCQLSRLTFPFALCPISGKIDNQHLCPSSLDRWTFQTIEVPASEGTWTPGPVRSTIKSQSWAPLPLPLFYSCPSLFSVYYVNSNLYFTTIGAIVSFIPLP